jgi:hypothetical protein
MDDSTSMMPDDLDRELADALAVDPSAGLPARIRERISAEAKAANGRWQVSLAVAAGLCSVVAAGTIWLSMSAPGPLSQPQYDAVVRDVPATGAEQPDHQAASAAPAPTTAPALTPTPRATPTVASRNTVPPQRDARRSPAAGAVLPGAIEEHRETAEVLLSDAEKAGVRLLFESAASGRLKLPEDMLQDPSVPIARDRPSLIPISEPFSLDRRVPREGDVQ